MRATGWGATDVGRRRERNEDDYYIGDDLQLYIVADGMGGHLGGGMASKMAVSVMSRVIRQLVEDPDTTVESGEIRLQGNDPASILQYAIQCASRDIYERAQHDPHLRGMGTTVVVLWIRAGMAYVANVGDSRGYLRRGEGLLQLTVDHSLVGEQIRAGLLSEQDAKSHRLKNIITRSVGFQPVVDVDVDCRPIRSGDCFLLCTDGLTNMVPDAQLQQVVADNPLPDVCRRLIDLANQAGGDDNITVLLASVSGTVEASLSEPTEQWDEPTEHVEEQKK